ncbi:DUF402 domain-containing protein [Clostridium omnivorum]|uniref:DUF402 domain-containing protein n=1 Tax=Clostridium omnivorum TaxID=1604902 RepID=A0ABQ5N5A5_9CLOT|nr:DUF402 domain-containing protein [Clostridium sp. E14]GLC30388.1 hypothetical protein bsdE14_17980 [Clostridium sp. E14]
MKRTYADRANWRRILEKRFYLASIDQHGFRGKLSIIHIDRVSEPLVIEVVGKDLCLANEGFIWMQYFPEHSYYAVTSMFNEKQELIEIYVDICLGNKVDSSGMPYYDDLYLDVVLAYSGEILLLDEDELEDALKQGEITKEQFKLAYEEAEKVIQYIKSNKQEVMKSSEQGLEYMLNLEKKGI